MVVALNLWIAGQICRESAKALQICPAKALADQRQEIGGPGIDMQK